MKNVKMTICLMAAVGFMAAGQGFGYIEFMDGGTHNINYSISDDVWVDMATPGAHTTINLLNGGTISVLRTYQDSQANISGGNVALYAFDRSRATISNGLVGYLDTRDNSQVVMSGGSITQWQTYGSSQMTISGGSVGDYQSWGYSYDSSRVVVSGGSVEHLWTYNNSQVAISGGSMYALQVSDCSQITISGGSVFALNAQGNSNQIIMSGGSVISYLGVGGDNSYVKWSGGTIKEIWLEKHTILTIDGSNFAINGTPVGFGEITSILGGSYGSESYRRLTGTLANGNIINSLFRIGDNAKIVLVSLPPALLTIKVEPNNVGIDTVTPNVGTHSCGGWVNINADRFVNCPGVYKFDHWVGDVNDATSAATTVFMGSNKTVTAVFEDGRQCGDECHPYPSGDISKDCKVNFVDIALIASSWLKCTRPECD